MTPLRQRMLDALVLRGMAERTQESYIGAVGLLARHYMRSPDTLSAQQVQDYLLHPHHIGTTRGPSTRFGSWPLAAGGIVLMERRRRLRVAAKADRWDGFEPDLDFQRVFAEHEGGVWYASRQPTPTTPVFSIPLTGMAGQALHRALGIN